jgi:hypothetical protein
MSNLTVSEILETLYGNIDNGNLPVEAYIAEAERQLNELILGIIGEDEQIRFSDDTTYGDTVHLHKDVIWGQNQLRAEQRQHLKETEVKDEN